MFKLFAILLLFCMTVVLGELDFVKLTDDCIRNTLDAVKSCKINDNIEVYDLREGSTAFRCLTYTRDSIEGSFDIFTLKIDPPFNLHYVSIC